MTGSSTKQFWWMCDEGHEWEESVVNKVKYDGCPFCTNRRVLPGFNDFATKAPKSAKDWHPTKNGDVTPDQLIFYSAYRAWWICDKGHEWAGSVKNKYDGGGCSHCSGILILPGFNDLVTVRPDLSFQWHPTKNETKKPDQFTVGSSIKAWWLGPCGHEWECVISDRRRFGCPVCSGNTTLTGFNDFATKAPQLVTEWHPTKNLPLTPSMVSSSTHKKVWWECQKSHIWDATVGSRVAGANCPSCTGFVSKAELELCDFLTNLGLAVVQSDRSVLGNRLELDLYIPDLKFGIEFNGVYWHSEAQGKGKDYHKAKYDAAQAAGIQLAQIWEDDWRDRKLAVMRALAHKLGVTSKLAEVHPELADVTSKVFARSTKVVLLTTKQAQVFLEANHIQGFASGSYYLGLEGVDGVLRAVMVLKREADAVLNIVRYATAGSVTGGFTKLLSHATKTYNPSSFVTFADHTISDGGLYEKHGFVVDKLIAPDYMYVVRNERKHKFGYRLKRFRNDPNLLWEEGLTERELAALNNLHRIWDAGKTRYRLAVR